MGEKIRVGIRSKNEESGERNMEKGREGQDRGIRGKSGGIGEERVGRGKWGRLIGRGGGEEGKAHKEG